MPETIRIASYSTNVFITNITITSVSIPWFSWCSSERDHLRLHSKLILPKNLIWTSDILGTNARFLEWNDVALPAQSSESGKEREIQTKQYRKDNTECLKRGMCTKLHLLLSDTGTILWRKLCFKCNSESRWHFEPKSQGRGTPRVETTAVTHNQERVVERVLRHVSITGLSSGIRDTTGERDGSQIITRQECQRKEIGPDPVGVGAHSTIISAGS